MLEYPIQDVLNRLSKTSEELRDIVSDTNISGIFIYLILSKL